MRTKNKRNKSKFLISYNYQNESGVHGFGSAELTIKDSKFHRRHLSPVVESIKKDCCFETFIVLNIIKLQLCTPLRKAKKT